MNNRTSKKSNQKHNGIKYLITSASLVSALAIWNQLSSRDQIADAEKLNQAVNQPAENQVLIDLPPIPTVAPLFDVSGTVDNNEIPVNGEPVLRSVGMPTPEPVNTPQITIERIIINNQPAASNNAPASSPPVNQTGSSK